ncbi:hypothetical protein ACTA71_003998 [Dictyostelium dimigraforme]
MSLILPIPAGINTLLITENDLGRGFSIDENGGNAKKNQVFICDTEVIKSTFSKTDSNNLTLISDNESLKEALDIGGELSLSYGLISGKVMGNYIDSNISNNKRLTFLYTRRIVDKVVEISYHSKPSSDISKVDSIDSLKSGYGLFYINKIEYGAILDLKITLESSDESKMNQIKGELGGSISIGALSLSVKAHIDKEESNSSSRLKVTSTVLLGGCETINKTDIQSLEDAMNVINSFKIDKERLVPVRMEIAPIPSRATPLLTLNPIELNHYKNKLSSVGKFYWEFQQMIIQLETYSKLIFPLSSSDDQSIYINNLYAHVNKQISILKEKQGSLINFFQCSMKDILIKEIPFSDADISDIKLNAQQMIGSTYTETENGRWLGPTINKVPTYKGIYKYKDGSQYEGLCLNGKQHGKGKLIYNNNGNIDQIKSIDGIWNDGEVKFPSTIIFEDGKENSILDAKSSIIWAERLKKNKISNSLEFRNVPTSGDETILKYFVNVDLIDDQEFKEFYLSLLSLLSHQGRQRFNYLLFGIKGSGKKTIIKLFLNILTGQIIDPKILGETKDGGTPSGIVKCKINNSCRYEIEYHSKNTWMFGITLIDTPEFIDSENLDKDIQTIFTINNKIERIDGVSFIINSFLASTVKTSSLQTPSSSSQFNILSNIFSNLPKKALECFSTIITSFDNQEKEDHALNEMVDEIRDKYSISIDIPQMQELNKVKEYNQIIIKQKNSIYKFFSNKVRLNQSFKLIEENKQQLIGSKKTETDKGIWIGLTINNNPIYKGIHMYKDGSNYKGSCLNGKRHGSGILTYSDDSDEYLNQLESIDGIWVNDEISFPSTITFKRGNVFKIIDTESLIKWKDELNKKTDASFVEIKDYSTDRELLLRYIVNVDLINDKVFQSFCNQVLELVNPYIEHTFMFFGLEGSGKSTLIEFILNILACQVHSSKPLSTQKLKSQKSRICRYEIKYKSKKIFRFGITLIDEPGNLIGQQGSPFNIIFVTNATRIIEQSNFLKKVFENLRLSQRDCLSTFITFCDNSKQANGIIDVLNEHIEGIKDKPTIFIDNPWLKFYKETSSSSSSSLLGFDNTEEIQKRMESKIKIIQNFFIERIKSNVRDLDRFVRVKEDQEEELLFNLLNQLLTSNSYQHQ